MEPFKELRIKREECAQQMTREVDVLKASPPPHPIPPEKSEH